MRLGMPALIEFKTIEENVLLAKELGLDFVELNLNFPYCLPKYNQLHELKRLKEEYEIDFTLHFPDDFDYGTIHDQVRKTYIDYFMDIIHFYKELDISVVTIHLNLGQHMTLPNKKVYIYEESPNAFYTNLVESVRVLSNFASQYGIKVCVENTNQASFVEGAIRRLEASNAAFTWDVGHDYKNFQMMFEYYINKYNLNIGHMHLHNVQDGYDHLPLQTGEVNVKNYLGYAKERGIDVVIEVKDRESLIESCEFIFEEETE